MKIPKIDDIVPNDEFHEEIYPGVWLMDNHKWAFWAWLNHFTENTTGLPAKLFHFDYHWDAVNDFQSEASQSDLFKHSLTEAYRLVTGDFICKDGFIAPAIIKGFFNEIHFYCKQKNTQVGFTDEFLNNYMSKQYVYNTIDNINVSIFDNPYAFDLDIDLFNDSEMYLVSKLWPEAQIGEFFRIPLCQDRCRLQ